VEETNNSFDMYSPVLPDGKGGAGYSEHQQS